MEISQIEKIDWSQTPTVMIEIMPANNFMADDHVAMHVRKKEFEMSLPENVEVASSMEIIVGTKLKLFCCIRHTREKNPNMRHTG
jgi:uncharacterized protein YfeS